MATTPHRLSPISKPSSASRPGVRYRCGFPGCNKRYASTDGVRKHARKTHLAWLKSVDEGAVTRDRQTESKPSTYCVKEEGFPDDDIEIEHETSPSLTPTMVGLRVSDAGPSEMQMPSALHLPEAAQQPLSAAAQQINNAAAIAAAAAMLGGTPQQPPLAWLLAQSAMATALHAQQERALTEAALTEAVLTEAALAEANAAHSARAAMQPHEQMAHALPTPMPTPLPVALPVNLGGMLPWMAPMGEAAPAISPAMLAAAHGIDPRLAFEALPGPVDWSSSSPDLSSLFRPPPSAPAPAAAEEAPAADPLCLTPPQASDKATACVSPFELDKKPPPSRASAAPVKEDATAQPAPDMSPTSTCVPFEDSSLGHELSWAELLDDSFPVMKEAEYKEFVETLLA